ncbi:flagellar biosynthesis protein FlhB [Neobacillus sp. PS3-40]|jgi:flagellar biosynthesis protein FlhB|uniref:flagellar biosynthesis protein FlhB n=1 Tax=Neobacillus sp. PS3-40 TaxID=3070679 RepID=UPI0027DF315C|nr:flagellar biosynthesis protein FlhB [Neobacillus sp. PS3-40]WML43717.1 flagellar biosynthesis protein FlhB [Neobacillus sp. PS3-40]
MKLYSVDLQFFSGEKTEKATPKKRQEARKKGQTAKSQDINTAVVLLAVFFFMSMAGGFMKKGIFTLFENSFQGNLRMDLTEGNIQGMFLGILKELAIYIGPILLVALLAGVISNFSQVGFMFTSEAIQPKLEKINPISGFKRVFSMRAIVELMKSILKIGFIGIITFSVLWKRMDEILVLSQKSIGSALATLSSLTIQMGLFASGALLFLAILDFLYQKFDFEKNIRMSKQDIKDEYKNTEGDPLIKSRIKQMQREIAMRRMMQEVPKADVVITNPTHFAIAIRYDESKRDAPFVVAKGVDFIAQKIKMVAKENDVMTVENRPLARALYSQTEIGDAIPEEFFKAVAEILAFVYKVKNKI